MTLTVPLLIRSSSLAARSYYCWDFAKTVPGCCRLQLPILIARYKGYHANHASLFPLSEFNFMTGMGDCQLGGG